MYTKFIQKYQNQSLDPNIYVERHHIVPKYLNGGNDQSNIIILTYRQHILAHLLLYRKYNNLEDLCAYRLMRKISTDRKQEIGKMIGAKHIKSGHIKQLGLKNKESNWINEIKTKESLSLGGRKAGQLAKNSGQIHKIATKKSRGNGGRVAGNLAKQKNQIQKLGKYKGIYVYISSDKKEFQHLFEIQDYTKIKKEKLLDDCKYNRNGFSRRKKTIEELNLRWTDIK